MENAASTYEQLLIKVLEDNPENVSLALEKAKHRVLKVSVYCCGPTVGLGTHLKMSTKK